MISGSDTLEGIQEQGGGLARLFHKVPTSVENYTGCERSDEATRGIIEESRRHYLVLREGKRKVSQEYSEITCWSQNKDMTNRKIAEDNIF
jgi:hypothetical protein